MKHRMSNIPENRITEGVIWKQLLVFFFPVLLGAFFQQLYNTVDAVIIGRFVGTNELAAVGGSTGTIINLLVGFFTGLASGATVITARYYGAKDDESVGKAVHTGLLMAISGGAILTVIGLLVGKLVLTWMSTPAEVLPHALIYFNIYFLGMIPNLYYNIAAGILRAVGDSKRPLYILIASTLANVGLDLLFVVVLRMSVTGVALATVLCQTLSAVLTTICLLRTRDSYRLSFRKLRFDRHMLRQIIYIGLPAAMQGVAYSMANIVIQSNINMLGSLTVAAYTAYTKIDCIFWMILNAFGISVSTFAGQNYGAGRIDRVKKSLWTCTAMAMGTSVVLSLILFFFGKYIYLLFTADAAAIEIGTQILRFMVPFYITYVLIEVMSGVLRAIGFVVAPMIMTLSGVCALRLVWLFTYVPHNRNIYTILASYPMSWILTSALFLLYYFILIKKGKIPSASGTGSA